MKITMTADKETKNTVRFAEVVPNKETPAKIGIVYMPKDTLQEMGWKVGMGLTFEAKAIKPEKPAKAKPAKREEK